MNADEVLAQCRFSKHSLQLRLHNPKHQKENKAWQW